MDADIFDVLDISLQEDSYTSLTKHVLETEGILRKVTEQLLDGTKVLGVGDLRFRKELPNSQGKPDLWWDAETGLGQRLVILEFKIKAGESGNQLVNYEKAAARAVGDDQRKSAHLFYVTLDGDQPSSSNWTSLTHSQLVQYIDQAAGAKMGQLALNPVWGSAWQAYRTRLVSY